MFINSFPLYVYSFIGVGSVNTQQINAVASDPAYALIKPSVTQLGQLYSEVIKYTCEPGLFDFTLYKEIN